MVLAVAAVVGGVQVDDDGEDKVVVAEAWADDKEETAEEKDEGQQMADHELGEGVVELVDENQTAVAVACWPVAAVAEQTPLLQHIHGLAYP